MKRTYFLSFLFIQLLSFITLYSHGFGARTPLYLCCHNQQAIRQVYHAHKRNWKKPSVLSKCSCFRKVHPQSVVGHIKGTTNCYLKIRFGTCLNNDVICTTPLQEFFVPAQQRWVPAYQLRVGDQLLNKHYQLVPITHMQFVAQPLTIYAIEVEESHNYFVGLHGILTHNLPIPLMFTCGFSIPFGGGVTAGGLLGLIGGGPVTIFGGILIGGLVGLSAYALAKKGIPKLKFEFDIPTLKDMNWVCCDMGPFPLADTALYYKIEEEKKIYAARNNNSGSPHNSINSQGSCSSGGDPRDPRDRGSQGDSNPPRNSNNSNNPPERKLNHQRLTNKEAREQAKKWGYKEDKNPPFKTYNQLAFKKDNRWITPDAAGHNGGAWKLMERVNGVVKRIATLNEDGSPIKG
jgi:hypothetical protein